jgi:hypothetical protein
MATKKTKNKEPEFFEYDYHVNQLEYCCGIGEIGGLRELEGSPKWWGGPAGEPKFHTKKEQVDDLYIQTTSIVASWSR